MKEQWQLVFRSPMLVIGLRCDEDMIFAVSYLPMQTAAIHPQNMLADECARQLAAYFRQPRTHRFDVPLAPAKTLYQQRVRAVVESIPVGTTLTYGAVAKQLRQSSPRAVGGACRANDVPLFVPCHRVVAGNSLGGFMGDKGESQLAIKRHLLQHEGVL